MYSQIEWHAFQITSDLVAVVVDSLHALLQESDSVSSVLLFLHFARLQVTFVHFLAGCSFFFFSRYGQIATVGIYACNKGFQAFVDVLCLNE